MTQRSVVQIHRQYDLVTFRACCQNFTAPVQMLPDSWTTAACRVCKEKRRYFPAQIFRGRLSDGYDQAVWRAGRVDPYRNITRINRGIVYLGACLIAAIRLARAKQVYVRAIPTIHAIDKSAEVVHDIFIRFQRWRAGG